MLFTQIYWGEHFGYLVCVLRHRTWQFNVTVANLRVWVLNLGPFEIVVR